MSAPPRIPAPGGRGRVSRAWAQLRFLGYEVRRLNAEGRWWRWVGVWFAPSFAVLASYRLSRAMYLLLGPGWPALRVLLSPLLFALRPWMGGCEISYLADIGPGLRVLHPALGVVISGKARIGTHLILVGGNCIGGRAGMRAGELVLGDDVMLGANAVVLGPVRLGYRVQVAAGAVVVRDAGDGEVLAGVPAVRVSTVSVDDRVPPPAVAAETG